VDDHRTFADLFALALTGMSDLECVGTAHDAAGALALAEQLEPDVVVMDVRLGSEDGIEVTERLARAHPGIRIVVLTAHADRALMNRAAKAGACCLLPKDGSLPDMLAALRAARPGGFTVDPALLRTLVSEQTELKAPVPTLTSREAQVIQLLARGNDVQSVARELGISVHTCRGYVKSLLSKLDAHSQLEAVTLALRLGLVDV